MIPETTRTLSGPAADRTAATPPPSSPESQALMRAIYDQSPIAIELYDAGGCLLDINAACCALFGIPSAEAVKGFRLFEDPHLPEAQRERLRRGETVRYAADFDFDLVRRRGLYDTSRTGQASLDILVSPISGGEQAVTGYLVQIVDVTAQRQVEALLRQERWRLQSIIEGTRVGTWEWNVQTGETVFNETWAGILGYTLAELAPVSIATWEALAHPEDLTRSAELLERHFAGELPHYDCECRMRHREGHWVWVRDRGKVFTRTADGRPEMVFGTHSDISERKRREAELLEAVDRLQKALEEIRTLKGILPICAHCKKIRSDEGYWEQVEAYVTRHTEAQFSHGICPDCMKLLYAPFCDPA